MLERFGFALIGLLLLSTPAWADISGRSGTAPSVTVAGRTFTDLTNLKVLYCDLNGTGAITYNACKLASGTASYQVTAGKTLTIEACQVIAQVPVASSYFNAGYGDTDVGVRSAAAPTNYTSRGAGTDLIPLGQGTTATLGYTQFLTRWVIPAAKYPTVKHTATSGYFGFICYGYEA